MRLSLVRPRWRSLRWLGVLALLTVGVLAVRPGPAAVEAVAPNVGLATYERLRAAAASGDRDAAAALARFEAFVLAKGQTPASAAAAATTLTDLLELGNTLTVSARGFVPFYVRIDGAAILDDRGRLDAYVATRRAALASFAASDSQTGRRVLVQVGFERRPDLEDILGMARLSNAGVDQLLIDGVVGGRRLFTHALTGPAAAELAELQPGTATGRVKELTLEMGVPLCGADIDQIEWRVQLVRLRLSVADALRLSGQRGVLVVDPIEDAIEPYAPRVVSVNVGAWPSVTVASEVLAGQDPFALACEETK